MPSGWQKSILKTQWDAFTKQEGVNLLEKMIEEKRKQDKIEVEAKGKVKRFDLILLKECDKQNYCQQKRDTKHESRCLKRPTQLKGRAADL